MANESDERNLKILPDPFASSDVSCEGIKTDVVFNDVLLREKVLVVGDSGVGKTKLIESYLMNASKRYAMSNGMEFNVVEVKVPESNIALDLFLFEMSGQSILRQVQQRCVQEHCSYIIVVFDISSRKTLESAKNWVASVRSTNLKDIPVLLIGNKIDLRQDFEAEIDVDQGAEYSTYHGFQYFECSAENSVNVNAPFQYIAQESANQYRCRVKDEK